MSLTDVQKLDDDLSDAQLRGPIASLPDDPNTATLQFSREVPRKLFFVNPGLETESI